MTTVKESLRWSGQQCLEPGQQCPGSGQTDIVQRLRALPAAIGSPLLPLLGVVRVGLDIFDGAKSWKMNKKLNLVLAGHEWLAGRPHPRTSASKKGGDAIVTLGHSLSIGWTLDDRQQPTVTGAGPS